MTPRRIVEGLTHPAWLIDFLRTGGIPPFANWNDYAPPGASADDVADLFGANTPAPGLQWPALDRLRANWPGKLVVKGLLHPADAIRAAEAGADGIVVSNHGGRQIDCVASPVDMVPLVRRSLGDRCTIMIDSGVRRGSDILISRCLGAEFAFFARPTLYGAAAAGTAGIRKAIEIVRTEVDLTLGQIGCPDIADLSSDFLTSSVAEGWNTAALTGSGSACRTEAE